MKSKWFGLVLVSFFILIGGLYSASVSAGEEKVYIPDEKIRAELIKQLTDEEDEVVLNELPTVSQLNNLERAGEKNALILHSDSDSDGYSSRSLEGLQHLKGIKHLSLLMYNEVIDYRPLGGMTSLESLQFYSAPNSETMNAKVVANIEFIKELKNLKKVEGYLPALDLSPLSSLTSLEEFNLEGNLEVGAPLAVSMDTREAILANPVTYPEQLKNGEVTVGVQTENDELSTVNVISDTIIQVKEIPLGTEKLVFQICKSNGSYQYVINYSCPIIWTNEKL